MLLPRQLQSHKVRNRLISDHLELSHFIPSFASCSMAVSHSRLERHQVGTGTTLGTAAGAQPFCACFPLPHSFACPHDPILADRPPPPPQTFQASRAVRIADCGNQQWWFCGASPQIAGNDYMVSRGSTPSFGLEQALEGDFIFKKTFNLMNAPNQIYYCITCWEENLHHRVN